MVHVKPKVAATTPKKKPKTRNMWQAFCSRKWATPAVHARWLQQVKVQNPGFEEGVLGTPEQLLKAHAVLGFLFMSVTFGMNWETVERMHALATGGLAMRQAHVVFTCKRAIRHHHTAIVLRHALASIDPRFDAITVEYIDEQLSMLTRASRPIEVFSVAASLSIRCGFYGIKGRDVDARQAAVRFRKSWRECKDLFAEP